MQPSKSVQVVDLPRPELLALLREADLFVLASRTEYAPLVLYEALAAGVPFLSTDVGNAREIVEDTGAGVVLGTRMVGQGATDGLAHGMEELLADGARLARMRESASAAYRSGRFNWHSIAARYRTILADTADTQLARI
jgi:glycosyltransferase involved in cell wall biosynthesis